MFTGLMSICFLILCVCVCFFFFAFNLGILFLGCDILYICTFVHRHISCLDFKASPCSFSLLEVPSTSYCILQESCFGILPSRSHIQVCNNQNCVLKMLKSS